MERHLNERLGMAWRELEQLGVGQGILPIFIHFLGCVQKRHKDERERERFYHVVLIRYYNHKCCSFFFDETCFGIVAPSWLIQRHLSLWGNLCKTTALVHSLTSRELPKTCALDSWDCSCGWAMQGASLQGWKKSADLRDDVNPCHCHLSQPLPFLRTYHTIPYHTPLHPKT